MTTKSSWLVGTYDGGEQYGPDKTDDNDPESRSCREGMGQEPVEKQEHLP
jgi:hypothetical protein